MVVSSSWGVETRAGTRRSVPEPLELTDIQLTCELDGHELPSKAVEREAFVDGHDDVNGKLLAFERWDDATHIADVTPVGYGAAPVITGFGLGIPHIQAISCMLRKGVSKRGSVY